MFFVGFQILRRCSLFQELSYLFIVVMWGGMCFLGGDLHVFNCAQLQKRNKVRLHVFGRFDDYFIGVLQRFGARFVSAIARAFRLWFLEITFVFWCLVFIGFGYP
jgi:hypothetical protein